MISNNSRTTASPEQFGDILKIQNRLRMVKIAKRVGLAAAVLTAGGALGFMTKQDVDKPVDKAPEVQTSGTVVETPEQNDGYRRLVLREAHNSGVELTANQLNDLVAQAEELNPGEYGGPKQPRTGEPINIPNIDGGTSDSTPTTQYTGEDIAQIDKSGAQVLDNANNNSSPVQNPTTPLP